MNALTGEWVLVSPQRTQRPWQGHVDKPSADVRPAHDPSCYLCPGNVRAGGQRNPDYPHIFVFGNDYPALNAAPVPQASAQQGFFKAEPVSGECRVICYSPRHDMSLGELSVGEVECVVRGWKTQFGELNARPDLKYTLIFENRGELMGASNPHPHGQIWSTSVIPSEVQRELVQQRAHLESSGIPLLSAYLNCELDAGERIVYANESWVALVPYWAVWPFELLVVPRRAVRSFSELTTSDEAQLAELLCAVQNIYDGLFDAPFSYSMGWHSPPSDGDPHAEWILHAHFFPPLLRSASVRKFQVGFEMFGMPQRDITPEAAAERLRSSGRLRRKSRG